MALQPDDEVCHCFHVSLRKIENFCRKTKPQYASQISECLSAGTGCGGCLPLIKRIHKEVCGESVAWWRVPGTVLSEPFAQSDYSSALEAIVETETMIQATVYDTKPYDREHLTEAPGAQRVGWRFHEFRLSAETAHAAKGTQAVSAFVNDRIDRSCLEILAAAGVKHVALRCAGYNNVDVSAAKALGVAVTRVPAYSPHTVAEHAVALLLTLNRKIHRAYNRVRELNFSLGGLTGFELHGKTAGIIGTGKIGRITAQILHGFGMQVLAHDPFPDTEWAEAYGVRYVDFEVLLNSSDVVSLHAPLTPLTRQMLNEQTFALMKPGVFIVNTGRGKLIDTTALIAALKSGRVGAVALDVYEEEEGIFFEDLSGQVLYDDELARLLTFPNVLITAHQAFLTHEALDQIARVTVANILRQETGGPFLEGTAL